MSVTEVASVCVRPYRPADRALVLSIGADTAYFGEPVESLLEDRRLFSQAFYAYYTDFESPYCWAAEVDGEVAGFLAGCADSRGRRGRYVRLVLPHLMTSLISGRYRVGPRTWDYLRRSLGASLRGEVPHADLRAYPAHLHVNVASRFRGCGLARRLIQAYTGQLRRLRVPGVHLLTTSMNKAACRLYEDLGFRLLDARATRMWTGILDQAVENRCYGARLPPD
jgi:ribosomal protein S18 acetylase RimI-like enzyme